MAAVVGVLLAACASVESPTLPSGPPAAPRPTPPINPPPSPAAWPHAAGQVLARNERLLLYRPAADDRLGAIAARFLGRSEEAWQISDANAGALLEAGVPLLVPLKPLNPTGVVGDRVQTVPVLCYHRFGPGNSKMIMSPVRFAAQLEWLARNGYQVIRLSALEGFLSGQRPLPPKSVVITIDDGYESVHRHAFPLLKQYGFPATVFAYSDFIGAGDALRWPQMQEMISSGLIDIQSHSKSHRNLVERLPGETDERYRANLEAEMQVPRDVIQRRMAGVQMRHIAYPFGDANAPVTEAAQRHGFTLGLTVVPGGNAFYAQPMLLRRTMIFGDMDLDAFKARLQTSRPLSGT